MSLKFILWWLFSLKVSHCFLPSICNAPSLTLLTSSRLCKSSLPEWKLHEHRGFSVPLIHCWWSAPRTLQTLSRGSGICGMDAWAAEWMNGQSSQPGSGWMTMRLLCSLLSSITLFIVSTGFTINWYLFHLSLCWLFPIESKPPLERRLFPSHSFIDGCPEPRTVQHMKQKDSIKCMQHEWTPNFLRSNSTQTRACFLETDAYLHLKSW